MMGGESGLIKYGHLMSDAAVGVGEDVMSGMTDTLSGLSDALGSDLIDFNPTIAPVLDLSQVKKEAASLTDILAMPVFDPTATNVSAQNANAGFETNRDTGNAADGTTASGATYNFTQNNTSPKALSTTEIYRQTNNLVSRTKEGS
jgi:hypothetical protein